LPQVRRKTMSEPRIMELVADMFCLSDARTGNRIPTACKRYAWPPAWECGERLMPVRRWQRARTAAMGLYRPIQGAHSAAAPRAEAGSGPGAEHTSARAAAALCISVGQQAAVDTPVRRLGMKSVRFRVSDGKRGHDGSDFPGPGRSLERCGD
jgi:hypothetical protein